MREDNNPNKQTTGSTRAIHLLLVGSEPLLGRFLKESLEKVGFVVYQAADQQEAVKLLRCYPIDLILLDSQMGSGVEAAFCAELRTLRDVPIVMVTPGRRPELVLAAFLSGIDDYIVKPFQLREMKDRIQRLL
jgi:DNA-binding response OmpR family regulator